MHDARLTTAPLAPPHVLTLAPRTVIASLSALTGGLTLISLVFAWLYVIRDIGGLERLAHVFNVDVEGSLPTLFQAMQLALCALALALIAGARPALAGVRGEQRYWWGLSAAFAYLAIDEGASLHELTNGTMRDALNAGGPFYWAWVIPAGCALAVFGLIYLRFLLTLPARIRLLFIVSGLLYVSGALGLEMVGAAILPAGVTPEDAGSYAEFVQSYQHPWLYILLATTEELCEAAGILVFLYALLGILADMGATLRVRTPHGMPAARSETG
jgi:hypothetical protein